MNSVQSDHSHAVLKENKVNGKRETTNGTV